MPDAVLVRIARRLALVALMAGNPLVSNAVAGER